MEFGTLILLGIAIGVKLNLIDLIVRLSTLISLTGVRAVIFSWDLCSRKRNSFSVVSTLALVIEYVWNSLSVFSNTRMLLPKTVAWILVPYSVVSVSYKCGKDICACV